MLQDQYWLGLTSMVFFGSAAIIPFVYFIAPARYALVASQSNFVVRTLFGVYKVPWDDIDSFFVGSIRSAKTIGIVYKSTCANRTMPTLIGLFNASARDIVDSLNGYKNASRTEQ